jgi:hypothetical protein
MGPFAWSGASVSASTVARSGECSQQSALDIVLRVRRELVERNYAAVVGEINNERAAALGRAGRKVEVAIERCRELAAVFEVASGPADQRDALAHYRQARQVFERARWELYVHREALNLNDHSWVDRAYPPPPRL